MATASSSIAPLSLPPSAASVADIGPQNPMTTMPEQQFFSVNINDEDKNELVNIITTYRNQWAPSRLIALSVWMKNLLMWRGTQVLEWDTNTGAWFDALAWYRQNRTDQAEDDHLERWINNITLMFGNAFVGSLAVSVPQTVVRPENAEILSDVTTAKAAQEAIGIIERRNRIRQMLRNEFEMLYLYGAYFKFTRGVLDGNWSGYDEEPVFEDYAVQLPARKQCFNCGTTVPMGGGDQQNMLGDGSGEGSADQCPNCQYALGDETYMPAETRQSLRMRIQKVPRAMVRQTVHSPLEIDADPQAKTLEQTAILSFDQEIDIGEARMMLPAMAAQNMIQEGAEVPTTANAGYERYRRNEQYSIGYAYTSDSIDSRPTYSQNWMQPSAFYRSIKPGFAERMLEQFPEGLKLTMVGSQVVDVRPAVLIKEWSTCRLHEGSGLYCQSIAENVVPFNERFNSTMQIIDEWVETCSTGINVIDASRLDKEKMKGRPLIGGSMVEIPMKINGEARPIDEAFRHFDIPINPVILQYPNMLMSFCQLIAGLPPQTFGAGTNPGVETFGGQQQMLAQANAALAPYWENVKEEHALAGQNAIECLQKLLKTGAVKEIWDVIEAQGSQYRNNYVNLSRMQGRIRVYPDEDQGLPQSPEQLRQTFTMLLTELSKGNPAVQALMDVPVNQESMLTVLAPQLISPIAGQRAKTLQDINTLLEQDWVPQVQPDGSTTHDIPVSPDKNVENYPILKETFRLFRQENCDLRVSNPQGWQRLDVYYEKAEQFEAMVAAEQSQRQGMITKAGQPQQGPDPTMQQEIQLLMQQAGPALMRLAQIAQLDPMLTKGTANAQVSAGKEILDSALKVGEMVSGH